MSSGTVVAACVPTQLPSKKSLYWSAVWPSSVPAGWNKNPNVTELVGIANTVAVCVGIVESAIAYVLPPAESNISKDTPALFFLDKNWIEVVASKWEKPIQSVGTVAGSTNALSDLSISSNW